MGNYVSSILCFLSYYVKRVIGDCTGIILGLFKGCIRINYIGIRLEKERGYIHWDYMGIMLGIYKDFGKENGNCYLGFRVAPACKHSSPQTPTPKSCTQVLATGFASIYIQHPTNRTNSYE